MSGTKTTSLYDGWNPVVAGGNFLLETLGLDDLQAVLTSGTATSLLRDGTNSTLALSNSAGTTTTTYAYSPYGDTAASAAGGPAYQYTGRDNDGATGLYYYRNRYYALQLGRFVSEDTIGLAFGTYFYGYVRGDAVDYHDPDGREAGLAIAALQTEAVKIGVRKIVARRPSNFAFEADLANTQLFIGDICAHRSSLISRCPSVRVGRQGSDYPPRLRLTLPH